MNEKESIDYDAATSEFLPFSGLNIEAIWGDRVEDCLDKIILKFEKESLVIQAKPEDDSIHLFRLSNAEIDGVLESPEPVPDILSQYIGQKFAWGWVTVNQQNYMDGVVLSFNDITPKVLLNVMASSLYMFEIRETND